jgi:methyl-accepting chemotaxis protein
VTEAAKPLFDAVSHLNEIKQKHAQEKFESNDSAYHTARSLMICACIVSLVLGLILSFVISRGFSIPPGRAVVALEKVAAGDLTASIDVETKDEVGRTAAVPKQGNRKAGAYVAGSGRQRR